MTRHRNERLNTAAAPAGPSGARDDRGELLRVALAAAVPLWVAELRGRPFSQLQARAQACAATIAAHGDWLLYGAKRPGRTAEVFNQLAEAVAILALQPGGVEVFGLHFQAAPDPEPPTA
jgi:hypothetical protein